MQKEIYVVIDTNVLVSALIKTDSKPGMVIDKVFERKIIPVFDDLIMQEYISVLHRDKFDFKEEDIYNLILSIRALGKSTARFSGQINESFTDESDIKFYLVTLESRKKHDTKLTTGNIRHFPAKPFIVTPGELIQSMKEN